MKHRTLAIGAVAAVGFALAMVSYLGPALLTNAPTMLLLISAAVLGLVVLIWTRRCGLLSPLPIVGITLLLYFPVRGILLLAASFTSNQGINLKVLGALDDASVQTAALLVLLISLAFAASSEAIWRLWPALIGNRVGSTPTPPANRTMSSILRRWSLPLMAIGAVCQAVQIGAAFAFLRGDELNSGLIPQLIQLGVFMLGLGLVIARSDGAGRTPRVATLPIAIGGSAALVSGSKDGILQLVLAFVASRPRSERRALRGTRIALVAAAAAFVVLIALPSLVSYRRSIQDGATASEAILAIPSDLSSRRIVTGGRYDGGFPQYLEDAALYVTDRLHGFDSLVLATNAPQVDHLLSVSSLIRAPLGIVLPTRYWSSDVSDVGLYFAQNYWGSPLGNNTHIAITLFGQAQLAFGMGGAIVVAIFLGALSAVAARLFQAHGAAARALAYVLLVSALAFERDALIVIVTTERRLVLLFFLIAAAGIVARREVGQVTPPVLSPGLRLQQQTGNYSAE